MDTGRGSRRRERAEERGGREERNGGTRGNSIISDNHCSILTLLVSTSNHPLVLEVSTILYLKVVESMSVTQLRLVSIITLDEDRVAPLNSSIVYSRCCSHSSGGLSLMSVIVTVAVAEA